MVAGRENAGRSLGPAGVGAAPLLRGVIVSGLGAEHLGVAGIVLTSWVVPAASRTSTDQTTKPFSLSSSVLRISPLTAASAADSASAWLTVASDARAVASAASSSGMVDSSTGSSPCRCSTRNTDSPVGRVNAREGTRSARPRHAVSWQILTGRDVSTIRGRLPVCRHRFAGFAGVNRPESGRRATKARLVRIR